MADSVIAGRDRLFRQTCSRGVHRDWWADTDNGEPVDCPWCRIAVLEGAPAESRSGVVMSGRQSSRSPRAALTAAGETTSTGQVGAPAPEGVTPPARPGERCACGHLDVLHAFARDNRTRTACSVTSGR
jgi:hypothetical protein